jgi:hypothetical protein
VKSRVPVDCRGTCLRLLCLIPLIALAGCSSNREAPPERTSASNVTSETDAGREPARDDFGEEDFSEVSNSKDEYPAAFRKVYKEGGWEIPGIKGATERQQQTYLSETVSPEISLVELTPPPAGETVINTYFYHKDRGLIVFPVLFNVDRVWKFSARGRPFCYIVEANIITAGEESGGKAPTGKHSIFQYYDEDNDGRLETFESGTVTLEPRIPKWVVKK